MNTYYFDYEPGDRVKNPKAPEWGIGQVQSIIKNKVTVNCLAVLCGVSGGEEG